MIWTLVAGVVLSSNVVHATDPPPTTQAPAPERVDESPRWYGWQIAAVDVPMIVAFDLGLHKDSTALMAGSMVGYAAGSPVIHLANRNPGPAIVGAATRLALPFATWAIVRFLVYKSSPSTSDDTRNLWGATVGGLAATAVDAGFFAWKQPENRDIVVHTGWALSPWLPGLSGAIGLGAAYVGF